jgi:hypothetical protein
MRRVVGIVVDIFLLLYIWACYDVNSYYRAQVNAASHIVLWAARVFFCDCSRPVDIARAALPAA